MLSIEQKNLVEKIAKQNGFHNFRITVEEGSKKGDNYLGTIYLVKIKENDGTREDSLVLKCALKNEAVRAQMPIGACYSREVYLYETVLPAFVKLQEKYPLPHKFQAFAKMYGYSLRDGDEWLLMENITNRGFHMQDRKLTMDGDHVATVLKEHGKLHSLSFVMKHHEPEQFDMLKRNLKDYFKDLGDLKDSFTEGIKKKFQNLYRLFEGDAKCTEALQRCEEEIQHFFESMDEPFYELVIVHGDSWCNNMMFKYEDETCPTKPTELCFLDWQISKVTTPVQDLCYFMFLSSPKDVLDKHKSYLQQYYQVLKENLEAVGVDINSVFSYALFEEHWKKFCKVGLYIAITMIETLLKDEEEAMTFSEAAEKDEKIINAIFGSTGNEKAEYRNRLKDLVLMLVENDYI